MKDIILEILYNSIDFKTMINLRNVSREIRNIYDQPHFWYIINATDISTRDVMELREMFTKNKTCCIYNLSGKQIALLEIPTSIVAKLNHTKLLIF